MKAGKVRIISGKYKRRLLSFPGASSLRPTPDAVRETVFNWLMPYIQDRICLDLYAGSGALGFEAVSRGAKQATLVDKNPKVVAALRKNKQLIDAQNQISVTRCAGLQYLSTTAQHFDLVFLDPPFAMDELEKACYLLQKHALIATDGLIYLEHAAAHQLVYLPENWQMLKVMKRGGVQCALYKMIKT